MSNLHEEQLKFHPSINELLDTFRIQVAGVIWLKQTMTEAQVQYSSGGPIINLPCSFGKRTVVHMHSDILDAIQREGMQGPAPLFSKSLINTYRLLTIAVKDIIWGESDFSKLKRNDLLKFLKHIRNASAHYNKFYFTQDALCELPITWRGITIEASTEGRTLYMDFLKPGDLFYLLSDISGLV